MSTWSTEAILLQLILTLIFDSPNEMLTKMMFRQRTDLRWKQQTNSAKYENVSLYETLKRVENSKFPNLEVIQSHIHKMWTKHTPFLCSHTPVSVSFSPFTFHC